MAQILWKKLKRAPNTLSIVLIVLYQKILSPSLGFLRFLPFYPRPSCVFYPTCSEYAHECFKKYSFPKAFQKTVSRITRCHNHTPPQVDLP